MNKIYIKRDTNFIEIYLFSVKIIKISKSGYLKEILKKLYGFFSVAKNIFESVIQPVKHYRKLNNYVSYISKQLNRNEQFVKIADKPYEFQKDKTKLIAFYLPQYHSIPLNDKHYGKGFTDWLNVVKSIPQWTGHYQPRLPADMGFYDLTDINVIKRQVELAKLYGIYGFCFHYYWFSGNKLLEKPVNMLLENKNINMPFCICWANENWSTQWDGGNRQIIMKQDLQSDDGDKFFNDILPFIRDARYIKINNKPVLIIYKPDLFNKNLFLNFISKLREKSKENGFDDIYIITAKFTFEDRITDWGIDACVEFPPHRMKELITDDISEYINPQFIGMIYNMQDYILNKKHLYETSEKTFKTVFPSWDNSARKAYSGALVFNKMSPDLYKSWLKDCIDWTKKNNTKDEQFVFINAWNEWAEGAYLEPDQKYGYAYLKATAESII